MHQDLNEGEHHGLLWINVKSFPLIYADQVLSVFIKCICVLGAVEVTFAIPISWVLLGQFISISFFYHFQSFFFQFFKHEISLNIIYLVQIDYLHCIFVMNSLCYIGREDSNWVTQWLWISPKHRLKSRMVQHILVK